MFSIWNDRENKHEFTALWKWNGIAGWDKYRLTYLGVELHGGPLHFDLCFGDMEV